ncbi:hypothetical protein KEM48_014651 [Puccinia striiformis f. sp. tritici PST-130]|nr:hypothetical protein KEM48_014651 [Puccinia striiformis f. sp. tritici PST-130]
MWEAIKDHFTSKAITNQSLVYNEFLDLDFKGNDIAAFILILPTTSLLLKPSDRSRDDTTTSIKTEESSMKATSSKKKKVKCVNGTHNKEANHTESQCFELHPEEKEKFEKRWADKKGKAKVSSAVDQPSYSDRLPCDYGFNVLYIRIEFIRGISLSPSAGHFYPPEPEDLDESFEDPIDQTQQPQDDIEPLEEVLSPHWKKTAFMKSMRQSISSIKLRKHRNPTRRQ